MLRSLMVVAFATVLPGHALALDSGARSSTTRDPSPNLNRPIVRKLDVPGGAGDVILGTNPLSDLLPSVAPNGDMMVLPSRKIGRVQDGRFFSEASGAIIDPMGLGANRPDIVRRGPHFIWNNPPPSNVDGENSGLQIWMGDNPTATPAKGDNVAVTAIAVNGNGRNRMWVGNLITQACHANSCGAGYQDAKTTILELEAGTGYPNTPTDPWGGGFRKNGLEVVAQSGSAGNLTAAQMVWANDPSGVGWWTTGLAMSRVRDVGLLAQSNPNGTTGSGPLGPDGIRAFQTAVVYDLSDSAATIKVGPGYHNAVIDMTNSVSGNFGYLVKGRQDQHSIYSIGNNANFNMTFAIDSGRSQAASSNLAFKDRAQEKWLLGKTASGDLRAFDSTIGTIPWRITPGTNTTTMQNVMIEGAFIAPFGTPATSSSPCTRGQRLADANYTYVCIDTNKWRRQALSDF